MSKEFHRKFNSSKFFIAQHFFSEIYAILNRRAKTKLPKDVKKNVDEWKARSGALALCLLAYYDGNEIHTFQ